jgi:Replication-relaxation
MGERPGGRPLPPKALEILDSLAAHRVLSTPQVHAIHSRGAELRWAQKLLGRLRAAGLAGYVASAHGRRRLWFATERGVRLARQVGTLEGNPPLGAELAAGPLAAHALAVNEAAISFLDAAARRGDDFGPLAWRHEVFHPLSPRGRRKRSLIADAAFTYLRQDGPEIAIEQRFLEVDRATLPADRLAAELARYAELYRAREAKGGEPMWRASYPVFPRVHCVLAGAPRRALSRRRSTACVLLAAVPLLSRTPEVTISICLLEDLRREGPFAPVFRDVRDPGRPVDWLGQPAEEPG